MEHKNFNILILDEYKLKNLTWITPLLILVFAELLILNDFIISAIYIHMINFLFIILMVTFIDIDIDIKNILQSFMLLILLRIVNISLPRFFSMALLQYSLTYGIMFIPIYYTIKGQIDKEFSINFNKIIMYFPMGVLIGCIIATAEFVIINPIGLINRLNFPNLFIISIIMFVFIALVEEILFRPILQTRFKKIIGLRYSILVSGLIFGIMHSEYGQINEVLFASIIGIVIGYIFYRTKNLPFIITIHGTTNVILFGILPLLNR